MEIDRLVERYNEFNGPVEILRNEDVSGCPAILCPCLPLTPPCVIAIQLTSLRPGKASSSHAGVRKTKMSAIHRNAAGMAVPQATQPSATAGVAAAMAPVLAVQASGQSAKRQKLESAVPALAASSAATAAATAATAVQSAFNAFGPAQSAFAPMPTIATVRVPNHEWRRTCLI